MKPPPIPDVLRDAPHAPASLHRATHRGELIGAATGYAAAFGFIASVLGFAALGWVIDRLAGTLPWGIVVGVGAGFLGGTLRLMRDVRRSNEEGRSASRPDSPSR